VQVAFPTESQTIRKVLLKRNVHGYGQTIVRLDVQQGRLAAKRCFAR
jgi:hypothetical protein